MPRPPQIDFEPELRARLETNLARFRRMPAPGEDLIAAAVVVAVVDDEHGRACFVLTRRASRLRAHRGQWALPGGSFDEGESAVACALRELGEEVGIVVEADHVLGVLDDYPTRSGYVITPVVVWCDAGVELTPDPTEVAAAYRVPVAELDKPEVPMFHRIPESDRPVISVPLLGSHIHAPTAAVLYQFHEVAVHGRQTRVAQYEQPVFAWR